MKFEIDGRPCGLHGKTSPIAARIRSRAPAQTARDSGQASINEVTESGKPVAFAAGVTVLVEGNVFVVNRDPFVSFEVGSGDYPFASKWRRK